VAEHGFDVVAVEGGDLFSFDTKNAAFTFGHGESSRECFVAKEYNPHLPWIQ
jgi:hypothetical protein